MNSGERWRHEYALPPKRSEVREKAADNGVMKLAHALLFVVLLCWFGAAAGEIAVPPLTGRVVDQTGTLAPNEIAALSQRLKDLESRRGSQVAVLIVPTTQPETIEQFSIRVAEAWKIGRRRIDDGAILVVAKDDRHLRIEVGYGLEGSLTDATTKRIIDEDITPRFRAGDFAGGIAAGVDHMIRIINREQLPPPEPPHWQGPQLGNYIDLFNPVVLLSLFVVAGVLRTMLGRLLGSATIGGLIGVVVWLFIGSVLFSVAVGMVAFIFAFLGDMFSFPGGPASYGRRGGWSGGSWSGGGWSGGSGSGGGFGGGGGGFGGGGASGSW
jgi:uncharacterized protein